jgi:tellurite resistance protein
MHEENLAILKGLIPVAWADGTFADQEQEVIEGLLQAFEATPEEADEMRAWSKTPRTVDDIPISDLSFDDRRVLLQHAVFLSHADGDYSEPEKQLIDAMVKKLRIPEEEAKPLLELAAERAKRYMNLL